jgi:hypothetical protein
VSDTMGDRTMSAGANRKRIVERWVNEVLNMKE